MEYIGIMKQALDNFQKNLTQDIIRINGFTNDIERLKNQQNVLKGEVDGLRQQKADFDSYMQEQREAFEAECEKTRNDNEDVLAKSHSLLEQAKQERGQAKVLLAESEQEAGKVNAMKDVWTKKTKDLASVMSN